MNKEYENIELIDRYLQDKLSEEELQAFEKKLRQDMEFEKLFFEMEQLVAGVRFSGAQSTVEEKIERLEKYLLAESNSGDYNARSAGIITSVTESFNEMINNLSLKVALSTRQVKLAFAGTAATFMFTLALLFNLLRTPSPNVLFVDYYKPPMFENFGTLRSGSDHEVPVASETAVFHEAMNRYNMKDYQVAAKMISTIPSDKMKSEMKLYQALTNIQLENYGTAKLILVKMKDTGDPFANQAKWFLALCLVKDERYVEARPLLREVKEYGSEYAGEAEKLLRKIK